jgi:hypothetical protein
MDKILALVAHAANGGLGALESNAASPSNGMSN